MSVFKPLDVSRQEFTELISKSKLQGIGPEEPLYKEGRYSSSNFASFMVRIWSLENT